MTLQLGAVRPDPHAFKLLPRLEAHVDPTVPQVQPSWFDQDPSGARYPMDGNDNLSNCVAVWIAHGQESQSRFSNPKSPTMADNITADADVEAWYWAEVDRQYGTTPHTAPGPGLDPIQAALNWMQYGFPNAKAAGGVSKIVGACTVSLNNVDFLKWAGWSCRGFGVALELPDDWPTTYEAVGTWQVSGRPDMNNGHMVMVGGYKPNGDQLIWTWGSSKWATLEFIQRYGLFGVVVLPTGWQTIPGVNVATLEKELETLGGRPVRD